MSVNSEQALVSVVICFHNQGGFLAEAIESVLAQTYSRWEMVLVNDGSSDSGTEIARRYCEQLSSRIVYLQHADGRNHGLPSSRNLGIGHSRGEYVALLDADDVWLPSKLEQQMQLFKAHPEASMVFGPCCYWHTWTGSSEDGDGDYIVPMDLPTNQTINPPALLTMSYPLGSAATPCPSALLFRKSMAEGISGFEEAFDGRYAMLFEDQAFLAKVYLNHAVIVSDQVCAKYRRGHDNCITSRVERAGLFNQVALWYFTWLKDYFVRQNVHDPAIWLALDAAAWQYRHPALERMKTVAQRGLIGLKTLLEQTGVYRRSTT